MGIGLGRRTNASTPSAYNILRKPNPPTGVNIDANTYIVKRRTGQMDAVPTCRRLIDHTFLYRIHTAPRGGIGTRKTNVLTAICKLEALIGNADALIYTIWTGMAKTTVNHIPTVQPCSRRQCTIPDK